MFRIDRDKFLSDPVGARFTDVVNDRRIPFARWLEFFNDADRQRRMRESEIHQLRPALAGVILDLEEDPAFADYFSGRDPEETRRARMAVGVIAKVIMLGNGWATTGRKGSLGQQARDTGRPSSRGLSRWFTRAEHYSGPELPASRRNRTS